GCLQLLHNVADMNLDRTLAELQFIGDDLVRLAAPECLRDFGLSLREHSGERREFVRTRVYEVTHRKNAARRDKNPASHREIDGFHADVDSDRRGDVAASAALEGRQDLREIVRVGQDDEGDGSELGCNPSNVFPDSGVAYLSA